MAEDIRLAVNYPDVQFVQVRDSRYALGGSGR